MGFMLFIRLHFSFAFCTVQLLTSETEIYCFRTVYVPQIYST